MINSSHPTANWQFIRIYFKYMHHMPVIYKTQDTHQQNYVLSQEKVFKGNY